MAPNPLVLSSIYLLYVGGVVLAIFLVVAQLQLFAIRKSVDRMCTVMMAQSPDFSRALLEREGQRDSRTWVIGAVVLAAGIGVMFIIFVK